MRQLNGDTDRLLVPDHTDITIQRKGHREDKPEQIHDTSS